MDKRQRRAELRRKAAATTQAKIDQLEREIEARFLADLGLKAFSQAALPKAFAVWWHDFLRWSVSYNQLSQVGMDLTRAKFPLVSIGSLVDLVQLGRQQIDALSRQIIGQANINSQELRSLQVPLPPLAVQ